MPAAHQVVAAHLAQAAEVVEQAIAVLPAQDAEQVAVVQPMHLLGEQEVFRVVELVS